MSSTSLLTERVQIAQCIAPQDLIGGAVIAGDYVNMGLFNRCTVLIHFADGAAGDDIRASLYQATTNAGGGGAPVLNALITGRIFSKTHATTLESVGQWTEDVQAVADEVYVDATSGEQVGFYALEIMASDLNQDNDMDWIRCDVQSDNGAAGAKLCSAVYILSDPRDAGHPPAMPSAL